MPIAILAWSLSCAVSLVPQAATGAGARSTSIVLRSTGMPETLRQDPRAPIVWFDAEFLSKAEDPNQLMDAPTWRAISEVLGTPSGDGGCIDVGEIVEDFYEPENRDTVEDAIRTARVIGGFRVTGTAGGFYGGVPGQLLRLVPVDVYRGDLTARDYYAFLPIGRFSVSGKQVCKRDARFANAPRVGQEVVLFVGLPSGEDLNILQLQGPTDLITVDGEKLSLPAQYRGAELTRTKLFHELLGGRPSKEKK